MSSLKSNTKSQTVGTALGQSQPLLIRRSTLASSKSLRLPQVSPPPAPCAPHGFTRRHRAGSRGRGSPLKGARGVVTRRGWRRGTSALSREDDVPGRPALS